MIFKDFTIKIVNLVVLIIFQLSVSAVHGQTTPDSVASAASDTLFNGTENEISMTPGQDSTQQAGDEVLAFEVDYNAVDSLMFDLNRNEVFLFGNAYVKYGTITLTADQIIYNMDTYEVHARGGVDSLGNPKNLPVFKDGKEEFKATEINYNFNTTKGFIREVYSQIDEAYVFARKSKKQPDNHIHIQNGFFTTCDKSNPHYSFRTTKMIVIPDDKVVTGPGYVSVGKVPLPVGLPFIIFPINSEKASGIVMPNYGDSKEQGFFIRDGGYYWAINDHFHTEFLGTVYANGSWGVKNSSAYKWRYKFSGNFTMIYNDFVFGDRDINGNFKQNKTFSLNWNHRQDPKASRNSSFNAVVNFQNGNQYRNDISSSASDYVNRNFNSNISYRYIFPNSPFNISANAKLTQVFNDNDENPSTSNEITLPQVTLNMARIDLPLSWLKKNKSGSRKWYEKIGLTYSMNLENRLKYSPEQLDTIILSENNYRQYINIRNGIKNSANLSTSIKVKTLSISPYMNGNANFYSRKIEKNFDPNSGTGVIDTIRGFSSTWGMNMGVDLTTKLYGMYSFKGDGKVKAMRHQVTFTANISYNPGNNINKFGYVGDNGTYEEYSPYEGAIFRPTSSRPNNLYTFRIINDLEAKVRERADSTGKEKIKKVKYIDNLAAYARFDAFKDSVRWTDIAFTGRFTKLFDVVNINYNAVFDPYAYNSSGQKIKQSYLKQTGKLIRFKSAGIVASVTIKSKKKVTRPKPKNASEQAIEEVDKRKKENDETGFFDNLNIPWNVSINYNLNLSRPVFVDEFGHFKDTLTFRAHTVSVNANFTIFKMFRFSVLTGYDFKSLKFQPSRLALYVDLHCWELSMSLRPNGRQTSYSISFNVKSSLLKDLKIKRQDTFAGGGGFF